MEATTRHSEVAGAPGLERSSCFLWGWALLGALGLTLALAAGGESASLGTLTQLAGTAGCVSADGTGGLWSGGPCADGTALDAAFSVAVSRDGQHVYVASLFGGVAVFARDKATGALTQLAGTAGCVSADGTGGLCAAGRALDGAQFVAVSHDDQHVYVASGTGVAVFARDKATGALTQLAGTAGCVSYAGQYFAMEGLCAAGRALFGANSVAVSHDDRHVYVTSFYSSAVAVFARDRATGALTQLAGTAGCVSETGTDGLCAAAPALWNAQSVAVSHDDRHVYVASHYSNAVAIFARDKATGALTQLAGTAGCVGLMWWTDASCAVGPALEGTVSVAVSCDDRNVYAASYMSSAVNVFTRDSSAGPRAAGPPRPARSSQSCVRASE